MVKYTYKEFKTALNKLKYPDSWFWVKYTINPYSGCQHACIYCDARSDRYFLQQNFENEVIIKTNIDKILDLKIKRARKLLPDVVGPGGVNDAYQPIEKEVENTRYSQINLNRNLVPMKTNENYYYLNRRILLQKDLFSKLDRWLIPPDRSSNSSKKS